MSAFIVITQPPVKLFITMVLIYVLSDSCFHAANHGFKQGTCNDKERLKRGHLTPDEHHIGVFIELEIALNFLCEYTDSKRPRRLETKNSGEV